MLFGFFKAHHKITPRGKSGRGPGLGEFDQIWGSPLIFMQWLKVSTSDLVHRLGGQLDRSQNHTNDKNSLGLGHGMARSLQN